MVTMPNVGILIEFLTIMSGRASGELATKPLPLHDACKQFNLTNQFLNFNTPLTMDYDALSASQKEAVDQLRALTDGGDAEVAISVLESVQWDVEVRHALF